MNKPLNVAVAAGAVVVAILSGTSVLRKSPIARELIAPRLILSPARVDSRARALRPNYPYSVVPGGLYSPEEMKAAIARDPKLREHYRDLDTKTLSLVRLEKEQFAYVSFQKNGNFYWTKRKLRVPEGEVLLTDGTHLVKTRCGNRLSQSPMTPTAAQDIPDKLLSPPILTNAALTGLDFVEAPVHNFIASPAEELLAAASPVGTEAVGFSPSRDTGHPEQMGGLAFPGAAMGPQTGNFGGLFGQGPGPLSGSSSSNAGKAPAGENKSGDTNSQPLPREAIPVPLAAPEPGSALLFSLFGVVSVGFVLLKKIRSQRTDY